MDTNRQLCDKHFHETTWKCFNLRTAQAESNRVVTTRLHFSRCSRTARRLVEFRRSMVSKLSTVWAPWFGVTVNTWAALPSEQSPARSSWRSADTWCAGFRVSQRTVDAETNWCHCREDLWGVLLRISHLATLGKRVAMECSKARTARHPTRRGCHRPLETFCLAPYKKRLGSGVHTWHSLMKAGFCLFPLSGEHGHRSVKRLSCDTVTNGIGSRLFRASRCRPVATAWLCMRNSIEVILPDWKWLRSCASCCDSFGDLLNWYGMAERFIAGARWAFSCIGIPGFIRTDSPPTLRKSIPMNMSGHNPNNGSRMQRRLPLTIWSMASGARLKESDVPSACCGLAYISLICLGSSVSII